MEKMNILYIHSHDTGRCAQPYGYPVPTPALQRLAEEGVTFRQAFCCGPTCSPSRAALLSGSYPHECGMFGLAHRGFRMNDYDRHLAAFLSRNGYTSILAGVQHEATPPFHDIADVYDHILCEGGFVEQEKKAAEFLRGDPEEPFFLSVGFYETHRPFPEPGPEHRYCMVPPGIPDHPDTRRDMAGFNASLRALDAKVGIVLDALREGGLWDRTIVLYTTDHGIAFPGMKCTLRDGGIGVMLVMRIPGIDGGEVVDEMVSHVDVFPTLCDLLGLERPSWLSGESFMDLLEHGGPGREEVFAEINHHAAPEPQRCVRTRRWKYIRRLSPDLGIVLPNVDDGYTKKLLVDGGLGRMVHRREELYDLLLDPLERINLAGDPSYADVLEEMRGRLRRWQEDTADPALDGEIPAPPDARLNDPRGLSPKDPSRTVRPEDTKCVAW